MIVDEARLTTRTELFHVAAFQSIYEADECRHHEQRQGQHANEQSHQERDVVKAVAIK